MNKVQAIITLIRLPNLGFILLTQLLAWHFLILPSVEVQTLSNISFYLLAFSTVLIAAAGYMINDYFDIGIDEINKPGRVTIEKIFKRRTIIIWHILLNMIALFIAVYIAFYFSFLRYIVFQLMSILLLIFYSTTFKRKLIIGNLIISVLTAFTLMTIAAYELNFPLFNLSKGSTIVYWLYIGFAFLITSCREIVKDIEDVKGDDAQACKTIPLVWGIQAAVRIVYVIISILLILLLVMCYFNLKSNPLLAVYLFLLVILPISFVILKLIKAKNAIHFHEVSTIIKLITLSGILSMIFM